VRAIASLLRIGIVELGRALAATARYEQLRRTGRAGGDVSASPARRVYAELYADAGRISPNGSVRVREE
jgi:hypothetical protein